MPYGLSDRHLAIIRSIFTNYPAIQKVILYGSRAKGTFRTGSDIDMTIINDAPFAFSDLAAIMNDFDDSDLPHLVDLSLFSELENDNLIDHIRRTGKIIYERYYQS